MVLFPVDTMPHDDSFNIIGHVSSRIRYAGSSSMVSHTAMLGMDWCVLYDRAGGLCEGEIIDGNNKLGHL